ncbi:MAG: type B 50S ribosomal protein L31 [Candidatus Shikimatogenerans bostrichidophilus]|nr:MAG: type B 50S ribosomal protein L31 [Candidatus Shikimatogenerans bostrichidophilus]
MINKNYRLVVFKDINNNKFFITKSTIITKETIEIKNKIYPLYKMEISKYSHPFYIGHLKNKKKTGRIEKFKNKYKKYYKL